jgi:hypothetical protein
LQNANGVILQLSGARVGRGSVGRRGRCDDHNAIGFSFVQYPPMQAGASSSVGDLKEKIEVAMKAAQAHNHIGKMSYFDEAGG